MIHNGMPPFKLLVYGTQTYLLLKNFLRLLGFRMLIELLTFLSDFDKWQFGYISDYPLEVVDYFFTELRNTNCVCVLDELSVLRYEIWRHYVW